MSTLTRGVRNAFRNQIRTCSIVIILGLSIGLALTMLIARQAVSDKIRTVKGAVGNTVSVSPAGIRGFDGGGNALTDSQVSALSKLAHVTSVDKSLSDRLTAGNTNLASAIAAGSLGKRFALNDGTSDTNPPRLPAAGDAAGGAIRSFTPPIQLVGTTSPGQLSAQQGGGTLTLTGGASIDGSGGGNVALVGSSLAGKNNLKAGSTFTVYGTTVTVAGIFDAGNTFANNQVIMPLKSVQTLSGQAGAITAATVNVDSISNVGGVTAAVQRTLGSSADVTNDTTRAQDAVAPLENIQTIALYSLIGTIAAGSAIILLTMVMIVRERRREIGVLKAIGAANTTVVMQFAAEAVTFTLLGAVAGTAFGVVAANPITRMLVSNSANSTPAPMSVRFAGAGGPVRQLGTFGRNITDIHAAVGWSILAYGLAVALLIAVIGSALASFFIAKIRPAEVMRAE